MVRKHKEGRAYLGVFGFVSKAFLGSLILLVLIFLGVAVWLRQEFSREDPVRLVVQVGGEAPESATMAVVQLSPSVKGLVGVGFPEDVKVVASGERGLWKVGSLYALGKLERRGGELLARTVSQVFAVPFDNFLVSNEPVSLDSGALPDGLNGLVVRAIFGRGDTNLGRFGLLRLWAGLRQVRRGDTRWLDLSKSLALSPQTEPDGSTVYVVEPAVLDQFIAGVFADPRLDVEGEEIAILNATLHAGLGAQVARVVKNLGARVVGVSDSPKKDAHSTLVISSATAREGTTVKVLLESFSIENVEVGETSLYRASILLSVGEDYWERLQMEH